MRRLGVSDPYAYPYDTVARQSWGVWLVIQSLYITATVMSALQLSRGTTYESGFSILRTFEKAAVLLTRTLLCVFCLARLYVVIEAFISLRSLSPRMYETPEWPKWIPHL